MTYLCVKVKECFQRFDDNNDKRIDFQEFVMFFNWFQKQVSDIYAAYTQS